MEADRMERRKDHWNLWVWQEYVRCGAKTEDIGLS